MAANQLPLLPFPSRHNLGSDPTLGFTDPNRYETTSYPRRPVPAIHEKLPPVSQLLTPGGVAPSPFAQRFEMCPPSEIRSSHQAYQRPGRSESRQVQPENHYLPAPYAITPPTPPQLPLPTRDAPHTNNVVTEYHTAFRSRADSSPLPYSRSSEGSQQTVGQAQSTPSASQNQWYARQSSSYPPSLSSVTLSSQVPRHSPAAAKPVLKVVEEKTIPGEGPCYIYEDGSRVRKMIDGEVVNAHWGVTKAGKPRKRLPIACTTCREKKIKCDPAEPKCVQCDKSGRECRFHTA